MRISLMLAAVLVGVANATLYSLIGNNTFDNLFEWKRDPWSLYVLYALSAVFVGLLISAVMLRFAEGDLQDRFFARYGVMVMAICIGGAVLAIVLTTVTFLFDPRAYVPSRISEVSYSLAMVAIPGAMLGAVEGVVLALPLAWLLGLFKKRG
jgi:MFS family permease